MKIIYDNTIYQFMNKIKSGLMQPTTPEGTPPPGRFQAETPEGPPPGRFQAATPEGPPPGRFQAATPEGPPPVRFQAATPEGPPPQLRFQAATPEGPPPLRFQPVSPEGSPPPKNNKEDQTNEDKQTPNEKLKNMVNVYLASNPIQKVKGKTSELEIRFGTNTRVARPLTKIDYENVVKSIMNAGFYTENADGIHLLRIQNEYVDPRTGLTKISNIRGEMAGLSLIEEYCKTNSIQKVIDSIEGLASDTRFVKFTQKSLPVDNKKNDSPTIKPVDFPDFNFRVSYQMEQDYSMASDVVKNTLSKWFDSKKLFRYMNRTRFISNKYPVFVDISIVKSNKKSGKVPIPQYTIQDAGVFDAESGYEVELELDNSRIGVGTEYNTSSSIIHAIKKAIRIILGAIQGTNYPISYSERESTLQAYMKLIHGEEYQPRRVFSRDFVGPSSYTLQIANIEENNEDKTVPNIRNGYTVTDKADGERKLLYIHDNGRIYMIDTNMNVIFTGTLTREKTLQNSILDGEHIIHDKKGKYINLYAAFDIYYVNGKSVRELAFMKIEGQEEDHDNKYRLYLLSKAIQLIKPISIMDDGSKKQSDSRENTISCPIVIKCKEFYTSSKDMSIFQGCSAILSNIKDGIYEYNTDGLIFTPCNTGVASNTVGVAGSVNKPVWDLSFKWKPAEFNTIDFLVSVRKDEKTGMDNIHNIFQDGKNVSSVQDLVQYKTLILRCGFDEKKHGFLNPCQNMIDDILPSPEDLDNEETYKPVPFQPTNPYDPLACMCNIKLLTGKNGELVMKTEEGEYFEENMIVEFKYDTKLEAGWRWIPLRVRYDKTAELRAGMRNYGNAYHVANSNWKSIHNPITEEMISTGLGIPELAEDDDVYYNRANQESSTRGLRNFHNLYVKKRLILGVSNRKDNLIDYAVGKAGDLSKWVQAKLGFVFGIDISKDNIHNHLDGACARYLKERKITSVMPRALFVHGNSSLNIRSTEAFSTEKDKMIARAVFGNGPKDRKVLGEGVYKNYGVAQDGFHISSCQFALHYFFESLSTLNSFLKNLSECTKIGGYFIGTCYDGNTIFRMLRDKIMDEGIIITKGNKKIYEIVKMYNETGFPHDEQSLGYKIRIFQETINKAFVEYLVNFEYFVKIMEDYGFVLIPNDDAKKMGFPSSSGMFDELYLQMENEIARDPKKKYEYGEARQMSPEEKRISFMNRYFIFKKMRNVNADAIRRISSKYMNNIENAEEKYEDEKDATQFANTVVKLDNNKETKIDYETKKVIRVRKLKKAPKYVLDDYSPIQEDIVNSGNIVLKSPKEIEKIERVEKEKAKKPRIKIIR